MRPDQDPLANQPHHRNKPPDADPEGLMVIESFRDAVGLAMELADEYAFVNAGAVIDTTNDTLVDLVVAEGIGRTIEPITRWLVDTGRHWPELPGILFLSVRPFEADIVREQDLRLYRNAAWAVATAGGQMIDWIETDGDLFRSYAYVTCPASAWPKDEPQDRLTDGFT